MTVQINADKKVEKNLNAEFYRYQIGTFDLMVFALIEFIFEIFYAFDQMKEFDLKNLMKQNKFNQIFEYLYSLYLKKNLIWYYSRSAFRKIWKQKNNIIWI